MGQDALKKLKKSVFTVNEAREKGISSRMLSYFIAKGAISRVSHGIYAKAGVEPSFDTKSITEQVLMEAPQAVVGRLSALKTYGLLDEDPPYIELIVPTDNFPKRKIENAKLFRAPRKSFSAGVETKNGIRVTSLDRTLVECLRTGVSLVTVRRAFEEAQKRRLKPSLSAMVKFAKLLRVQGKFKLFQESIG